MKRLIFILSSILICISCSELNDSQRYLEIEALINTYSELEISVDSDGIPYYKGYSVSKEKFNEYVVGAGWGNTNDKYEVVDNSGAIYLTDLELWEPGFVYNFYVGSVGQLTEYDDSYRLAYGDAPLLYKNEDYVYYPDGTVRLSDGSFFMRVVYASADVIQAFKYLYTDSDGKAHYALCTFQKMTQEKLTKFRTTYLTDYYEYISKLSSNL